MTMPKPEEYARSTWQMAPSLDLPGPRHHIQYTLLDADPRPELRRRMARHPVPELPKGEEPAPAGNLTSRQAYLTGVWNGVFRQVTGDRVFLIVDDRATQTFTAANGTHHATTTRTFHAVCSDEPSGSKWLVTRGIPVQGRALAWCLEVAAQTGTMVNVTLARGNAIDLEEEYHRALEEV